MEVWRRRQARFDAAPATVDQTSYTGGNIYAVHFDAAITWDSDSGGDPAFELHDATNGWQPALIQSTNGPQAVLVTTAIPTALGDNVRITAQPAHLTSAGPFALGVWIIPLA